MHIWQPPLCVQKLGLNHRSRLILCSIKLVILISTGGQTIEVAVSTVIHVIIIMWPNFTRKITLVANATFKSLNFAQRYSKLTYATSQVISSGLRPAFVALYRHMCNRCGLLLVHAMYVRAHSLEKWGPNKDMLKNVLIHALVYPWLCIQQSIGSWLYHRLPCLYGIWKSSLKLISSCSSMVAP